MSYLKVNEFSKICYDCDFDIKKIQEALLDLGQSPSTASPSRIKQRIGTLRRKGDMPLESGNKVDIGQFLTATTTAYGKQGEIERQWVKADVGKQQLVEAFEMAIEDIASTLTPLPPIDTSTLSPDLPEDLLNVVISNDLHIGLFTDPEETGTAWDSNSIKETLHSAYDHLFTHSPKAKSCIVVDLGDLTEADNNKNQTPKSGNPLDVVNKHYRNLRIGYEALIYAIQRALQTHEIVYFYNIAGNHDIDSAIAIREVIRIAFINNPRVTVCDSPSVIKYHQHGKTLLGFAHGDNMKMAQASETMAYDNQHIFSSTLHRFFHLGHLHIDIVKDAKLCKVESHRNLPPNNAWAHGNGYRRGIGTMKSITYSTEKGEVSRQTYNV